MGVEIVCDVEGCESRGPAGDEMMGMGVPSGWLVILRPPDELARQRAQRALANTEMFVGVDSRGFGPQKLFICDKHELPKLKASR